MEKRSVDMVELAYMLTNGMNQLGEFLIHSAEELRELIEDPEQADDDVDETDSLIKNDGDEATEEQATDVVDASE